MEIELNKIYDNEIEPNFLTQRILEKAKDEGEHGYLKNKCSIPAPILFVMKSECDISSAFLKIRSA